MLSAPSIAMTDLPDNKKLIFIEATGHIYQYQCLYHITYVHINEIKMLKLMNNMYNIFIYPIGVSVNVVIWH